MKTFVVFDKNSGNIIFSMEDASYDGACVNVDIPSNKMIVGMDVTTNTPVLSDMPMPIDERLEILEKGIMSIPHQNDE